MTTTLSLDLGKTGTLNPLWSFGGNTCHAPLLLRPDLLQHLRLAKQELGFRYVRCHGTLSDDMDVVQADGSFSFAKIRQMLDNLLELGLRPFFELSFMPGQFASSETSICHYKGRTSPPKNWELWQQMIRQVAQFCDETYGADEVKTWYFEVWNEPDINFWSGSQEEYFKLYDLSAQAIKSVNPGFRVGGPSTSKTAWIGEFLTHVTTPSPDFTLDCSRCDFVSTHAYPSDLAFLDSAEGEVNLQNSTIMAQLFAEVRRQVDAVLGADVPIFCGEWNSSAGPYAANHDECNNAAFIVKTMNELSPLCQGSLYWNISDIYEEGGFHYTPFHGGYGLLNVNDFPKSSFHAFRFLNQLAGDQVACSLSSQIEGFGCLAAKGADKLTILLYYYREPDTSQPDSVTCLLAGLAGQAAISETIEPKNGSAYEAWIELARPDYLNRASFDHLECASKTLSRTVDLAQPVRVELGTVVKLEVS
jgi:xylan 1,4-beta-xylosidase